MVETKPMYTSYSIKPQPRVKIDRSDDVASVNGKPTAIFLQKKYNYIKFITINNSQINVP